MTDREQFFFAIGLGAGAVLGAAGWWLHFLIIQAAVGV